MWIINNDTAINRMLSVKRDLVNWRGLCQTLNRFSMMTGWLKEGNDEVVDYHRYKCQDEIIKRSINEMWKNRNRTVEICAVRPHEKWSNLNAFTVPNKLWIIEPRPAWSFIQIPFSFYFFRSPPKKKIQASTSKRRVIFKINC